MNSVIVVVAVVWLCSGGQVWGKIVQNDDGSGIISFQTPTLSDEEYHSVHIPSHLKCDACNALAYQFFLKFAKLHKKKPSLEKLPEADIVEGVEEVCDDKFETYGVKEVNKVKRLSGPGLETKDVPGVMAGGGKWPERLRSMCYQYLEEFGDEVIYKEYLKHKNLHQFFCKSIKKPGLTDVCLSEHEKTRNKTEHEKRRNKTTESHTKGDQMKDEL